MNKQQIWIDTKRRIGEKKKDWKGRREKRNQMPKINIPANTRETK